MDKGKALVVEDAYVGLDSLRVGTKPRIMVIQKEIEKLEAVKKDLEMQLAAEVKGKESLHSILASRKKALHERRLALERDVVEMTEQLQNERDMQAALDGGLGLSQAQISANTDEKVKKDPKEMNVDEDGKQNQKQRVDDL